MMADKGGELWWFVRGGREVTRVSSESPTNYACFAWQQHSSSS